MKQISITPELHEYTLNIGLREHPVLQALGAQTSTMMLAAMQTAPEQAQFMQFLLQAINAKNVLEVGTFTGYSTLAMALALPADGKVITCDINTEWTAVAQPFWQEAGMQAKIDLRIAPALATLNALIAEGFRGYFDFIFIDADKTNYVQYYEQALQLISPQGIIAIDNVLWRGAVIDATDTSAQTREIRRINALIRTDERVDVSLLAIGDGLFLVKPKRENTRTQ